MRCRRCGHSLFSLGIDAEGGFAFVFCVRDGCGWRTAEGTWVRAVRRAFDVFTEGP